MCHHRVTGTAESLRHYTRSLRSRKPVPALAPTGVRRLNSARHLEEQKLSGLPCGEGRCYLGEAKAPGSPNRHVPAIAYFLVAHADCLS